MLSKPSAEFPDEGTCWKVADRADEVIIPR